jgi:hypothetical protein
VKKESSKPVLDPSVDAESADSGVHLSRQALYERRMDEIYSDVQEGRCDFDEATDRVVAAILARTDDTFTKKGREQLALKVRSACASDPRLSRALGRR